MIFPRIQSCLRKHVNRKSAPDSRLMQYMSTSIHSVDSMEALVQIERAADISVQVRGPKAADKKCFFMLEEVLGVIDQVRVEGKFQFPGIQVMLLCQTDMPGYPVKIVLFHFPGKWKLREINGNYNFTHASRSCSK